MARLPPSRHTLHRRLRLLDRRTRRHSPLRTTFLPAARAICHSPGLPTPRRRQSDPNATFPPRSRPSDDASSSLSPGAFPDALVVTGLPAKPAEFLITDAVRLVEAHQSRRLRLTANRLDCFAAEGWIG